MKKSNLFLGNHPLDFVSFEIDETDVLTELTKKILVNPTVSENGEKTIGFPVGEGFNNIWFEIKTDVVGVTGIYNENTGELEITKATDWVIGDIVVVMYSMFTTTQE